MALKYSTSSQSLKVQAGASVFLLFFLFFFFLNRPELLINTECSLGNAETKCFMIGFSALILQQQGSGVAKADIQKSTHKQEMAAALRKIRIPINTHYGFQTERDRMRLRARSDITDADMGDASCNSSRWLRRLHYTCLQICTAMLQI